MTKPSQTNPRRKLAPSRLGATGLCALAALGLAACGSQQESKAMPEIEEPDTAGSQETAISGVAEPNTPNQAIADETAGSVENELTDEDEAGIAGQRLGED